MNCHQCGGPVGSTYLRCPQCGAQLKSRNETADTLSAIKQNFEPSKELAALQSSNSTLQNNRGPQAATDLPQLPRARRFPLLIIGAVVFAVAILATLVSIYLSTQTHAEVNVSFAGNWETLDVKPSIIKSSWFKSEQLQGVPISIEVKRADGQTIYQGSDQQVKIEDIKLGSKEALLVTACAYETPWYSKERRSTCASTAVPSSAKRYMPLNMTVVYAKGGRIEHPSIAFQQELQRLTFGSTENWESLKVIDAPVQLKVWVSNSPNELVQLKLSPTKTLTTVDLTAGDGFASFLESFYRAQASSTDVGLEFQFFAGSDANSPVYPTKHVNWIAKTQAERYAEIQAFGERIGRHMVGNYYGGGRNIQADIDSWNYDIRSRAYTVLYSINWNGKTLGGIAYGLVGRLSCREDGSESRFELLSEKNSGAIGEILKSIVGKSIKPGDTFTNVM